MTFLSSSHRSPWWLVARLVGGLLCCAGLAFVLWPTAAGMSWLSMLFAWILLTLLADEFGGWFGYIGVFMGILPLIDTPPTQWTTIYPLVGSALFAALLVKHSGGIWVLPFSGALFMGTLLAADFLGHKLDPGLTLVHDPSLQWVALVAVAIALGISFIRQMIQFILQYQARRKAARLVPVLDLQLDSEAQPNEKARQK